MWQTAHPTLRRIAVVLALIGLALAAGGVYLDSRGWWSSRPFLTNLASSVIGALVAIPLAVIVISDLTERSTRHRNQVELKNLLWATATHIWSDAGSIVRRGRTAQDLDRAVTSMALPLEGLDEGTLDVTQMTGLHPEWARGVGIRDAWLSEFVSPTEVATLLVQIKSGWGLLSSLKGETYRAGFAWLSPETEASFESAVADIDAFVSTWTDWTSFWITSKVVVAAKGIISLQQLAGTLVTAFVFEHNYPEHY